MSALNGEAVHYKLQEIRRVQNIPLEIFGLTMSEIELISKVLILSFVFGVLVQAIANVVMPYYINLMFYPFASIPIAILGISHINKKYGKGLIFFLIAKLQNKDSLNFSNLNALKNEKK